MHDETAPHVDVGLLSAFTEPLRNGARNGLSRSSRPEPGRSLGATVSKIERPVRLAVQHLFQTQLTAQDGLLDLFDCTVYGPGSFREDEGLRLSWFIICVTLIHGKVNGRAIPDKIANALAWFFGENNILQRIVARCDPEGIAAADNVLSSLALTAEFWDLLPYVLEPHGHVTRNEREKCDKARETRSLKKESGVYYTPSDVAEFMVGELCGDGEGAGQWIDPACGTGVFLRAVLRRISEFEQNQALPASELVAKKIFGIDKSALSTDLTAFVLMAEFLEPADSYFSVWKKIKKNIVCIDTLRLVTRSVQLELDTDSTRVAFLTDVFPTVSNEGFDHIVMNPPYSVVAVDNDLRTLWHSFGAIQKEQSGDAHLPFTEMLWRLVHESGTGAAVLPISIGANTTISYGRLRDELLNSSGVKEFLFFDREPQALFGEDIKTRNVIVFRKQSATRRQLVRTSRLLKWTAEQRPEIFSGNRATEIDKAYCKNFVPKLGSQGEVELYKGLLCSSVLSAALKNSPASGRVTYNDLLGDSNGIDKVLVSGTAYNFINAFFADSIPKETAYPYSSSPLNALLFKDEVDAFAGFALISSKLAFWLWHVEGDGFHVTGSFLKRLPMWAAFASPGVKQKLSKLGRDLWDTTKTNVVASVNGGRQTYSFHAGHEYPIVEEIDGAIIDQLGISVPHSNILNEFLAATVSVDGKRRSR